MSEQEIALQKRINNVLDKIREMPYTTRGGALVGGGKRKSMIQLLKKPEKISERTGKIIRRKGQKAFCNTYYPYYAVKGVERRTRHKVGSPKFVKNTQGNKSAYVDYFRQGSFWTSAIEDQANRDAVQTATYFRSRRYPNAPAYKGNLIRKKRAPYVPKGAVVMPAVKRVFPTKSIPRSPRVFPTTPLPSVPVVVVPSGAKKRDIEEAVAEVESTMLEEIEEEEKQLGRMKKRKASGLVGEALNRKLIPKKCRIGYQNWSVDYSSPSQARFKNAKKRGIFRPKRKQSALQKRHTSFVKAFIEANGNPGNQTQADVRNLMKAANAAWNSQTYG